MEKNIEQLSESELFRDVVWVDGGMMCEVDKRNKFGDEKKMGPHLGEWDPATKTCKCFGNLEGQKEGDAKMR